MEITQAACQLLPYLQKMINPPVRFDSTSLETKEDDLFFQRKSRANILWSSSILDFLFLTISSAVRIKTLFRHWKEGNNIEQLCVFAILLACCCLDLWVYRNIHKTKQEIAFSFTQALKLAKFELARATKHSKSISSWKEAVVCSFAITIILGAILVCCAFPLLSYHPIKLIVGRSSCASLTCNFIFEVMLGVLSGLVYTFAAYHGTTCDIFALLIVASFAEIIQVFSYNLFRRRMLHVSFRQNGFHRVPYKHDKTIVGKHSTSFDESLKCYRCIQILVQVGNQAAGDFMQVSLIILTALATFSGYAFIKLYAEFPFPIYFLFSLLLPAFIIIVIMFCALGSIPNENATGFKRYWRWRLNKRVDRMRLKACPAIAYAFGFVVECRRMTAFTIIDVLVNLIATLTLIHD